MPPDGGVVNTSPGHGPGSAGECRDNVRLTFGLKAGSYGSVCAVNALDLSHRPDNDLDHL